MISKQYIEDDNGPYNIYSHISRPIGQKQKTTQICTSNKNNLYIRSIKSII